MFTCRDGKGGELSSQASKMLLPGSGLYLTIIIFTITTEIHARSLANFYCPYADVHINLKFM